MPRDDRVEGQGRYLWQTPGCICQQGFKDRHACTLRSRMVRWERLIRSFFDFLACLRQQLVSESTAESACDRPLPATLVVGAVRLGFRLTSRARSERNKLRRIEPKRSRASRNALLLDSTNKVRVEPSILYQQLQAGWELDDACN
jgi:hypothetical protein